MKIIIFDINQFVSKKCNIGVGAFECINIKNKYYHIKPGSKEFLKNVNLKYKIAFWNFKTKKNCRKIISKFLEIMEIKPEFIWYRSSTELVRDSNGFFNGKTVKNINRIILSPSINKNYEYNQDNIFMTDDLLVKFDMSIKENEYHENSFKVMNNLLN